MNFDLRDVLNLVETFDPEPVGDPFLDARYEEHRARFGHGVPYWRLFYHLGRLLKPAFSVELGAWRATCAAHLAAGYPYGDVVTIDHHTDPGDDENKAFSQEAADRYGNLHYIQGWTWDVVGDVAGWSMGIDILFIDSWHQYDKAMQDWNAYRPLLSPTALVICDDLLPTDGPVIAGMTEFWAEVSRDREAFLSGRPHPGFPMGFAKWTA